MARRAFYGARTPSTRLPGGFGRFALGSRPEAFYERDGDRYAATELTRGPWDPGSQHAGPPSR